MTTPHINAKFGDFAETVIVAGDPLRVKYIAKNFLTSSKEVSNVRGMLGFTGYYHNKNISIMSHGIGIPSSSIYVKELITHFGVKKIIRVGSCCSINNKINLKDIIIAMGASTDSKVNRLKFNDNDFSAIADYQLMQNAITTAKSKNIKIFIGNIFTTDLFYYPKNDFFKKIEKYGILGIDMETAGIYSIASEHGIQALTMCTVSDQFHTGKKITSKERQTSFTNMIEIALESTLLFK